MLEGKCRGCRLPPAPLPLLPCAAVSRITSDMRGPLPLTFLLPCILRAAGITIRAAVRSSAGTTAVP